MLITYYTYNSSCKTRHTDVLNVVMINLKEGNFQDLYWMISSIELFLTQFQHWLFMDSGYYEFT